MRVIMPAPIETAVTASIPKDQSPARSNSSTAQMLATLAGAISACVVGWLIFGFGSFRTIGSRRT
jgi:high-affinity Fe2+/Pb2+ permease